MMARRGKSTPNGNTTMTNRNLEIIVRSRTKVGGSWHTEWSKSTRSWRKAWSIVDGCGGDRNNTRWIDLDEDTVLLDIGGVQEHEDQQGRE